MVRLCNPGGDAQPNLASDHTIAVDDLGHVFAVFAADGSAFCARSDDAGASFAIPTVVAPDDHGEQSLPVIALLPNNRLAVAWQQTTGQSSEVRYAISADGGATFEPSQALAPALSNQTAPDICAAGDTLYFSFTQDGQATFARVPEAPPPAPLAAVAANLVSDPAFDQFDGPAPGGWTVDSWNQEFLQERFGRAEPGRDGTGACLELQAGSGASIINFTGPEVPVEGDSEYFFKGYYASTCERVSVKGAWLNGAGEPVRTFEIRLPETQDEWIHFIKQLSSPVFATKVRLGIEKKWQSGRVRFDDFSLRRGTVTDYATEFDLPDSGSTDPWLPIFSWLGPYSWPQLGPEMAAQLDRDEYHLDYALAGFNVGYRARFGLRYHPSPPADAAAVAHLNADPAVWVYHAGERSRGTAARYAETGGLSGAPVAAPTATRASAREHNAGLLLRRRRRPRTGHLHLPGRPE